MNNIQNEFRIVDEGSSNQAILDLIKYIEENMIDFTNSREYIDILKMRKNENQHSISFCVFMTNESKSKYCFITENPQKGSHRIDIGVYHGSNLIFTIEAKLLPTPKGTKKKPRLEHEYVFGEGAGIQRFKDGFHGLDNQNNPLSENGMIAFIKENDYKYWFSKINQWILDARWDDSEKLEKIYFRSIAKLISKHPRKKASHVSLYHFWISVH